MRKTALPALLVLCLLLSACAAPASPAAQPLPLADIYTKMGEQVQLPPMVTVGADLALDFYGIDLAKTRQAVLKMASDSLLADEVLLIEAVDEAAAKEIENLLQGRIQAKAKEAEGYSPKQHDIIKKGHVVREGLQLALIVSPDADALLKLYKSLLKPGS